MAIAETIRKAGRTLQVHVPMLQELGKTAEAWALRITGGVHDPDLNGLRQIAVPDSALFLDVGANRGAATASMLRLAPSARMVAFEPNPVMVPRLAGKLTACRGEVHSVALGETEGEFPLFIPRYRGVVFDGLASLSESEAAGWLGPKTLYGFRQGHLHIQKVMCKVTTLDSYGLEPFFIKMDVQGGEYGVLKGALGTLAASEPIIFAESESLDIESTRELLMPWRYSVFRYESRRFIAGAAASNVYLIPESKRRLIMESAT